MLKTTPSASGLIGNFEQLTAPTYWIRGEIGDWKWWIENFGMSWGICSTLGEAYAAFHAEVIEIESDYDFSIVSEPEQAESISYPEF